MFNLRIDASKVVPDIASKNLIELTIDRAFNFTLSIDSYVLFAAAAVLVVVIFIRVRYGAHFLGRSFEIDEAEFGLGDQKIKFKPNIADQQIAYKIWVELSTRKIGLKIDLSHDVISEVYDSWFSFFAITRELIKDVPVQKFKRNDTEKLVKLSIEVLNVGIRPHLTEWQARFRSWYENQLREDANKGKSPQEIQSEFPSFYELSNDLLLVNQRLIHYREKMYELIKQS